MNISSVQFGDLKDYKIFCFNGRPRFLKVDFNRESCHRANYYDLQWNLLTMGECVCPPDFEHIETRPVNFDKMIEVAATLSEGHKFVRVDLYNIAGKIYFGELTFFPASGFGFFLTPDQDSYLGKLLDLK